MPPGPLAHLRGLLADAPSEATWKALCDALDAVDAPNLALALDYAEGHLDAWPDALRVAPARWGLDGANTRMQLARHTAPGPQGLGALVPLAEFTSTGEHTALSQVLAFLDAHGHRFGVPPRAMRWRRHPGDGRQVSCTNGVLQVVDAQGTLVAERSIASPGSGAHHVVVFAHDPACIWWLTGFRSGAGAVRLLAADTLETLDVSVLPNRLFAARMEHRAEVLSVSTGPGGAVLMFYEARVRELRCRPVRLRGAGDELLPIGLDPTLQRYLALSSTGELAAWSWPSGDLIHADWAGTRVSLPSGGTLSSGGFAGTEVTVPIFKDARRSAIAGVTFVDHRNMEGTGEALLPTGAVGEECVAEVLGPNLLMVQEIGWGRAWLYRVVGAARF